MQEIKKKIARIKGTTTKENRTLMTCVVSPFNMQLQVSNVLAGYQSASVYLCLAHGDEVIHFERKRFVPLSTVICGMSS